MNPYREAATKARAIADRLNNVSDPMADMFPRGGGYGRGSQKSRDRRIDARVNQAVKAVAAERKAKGLEAMADRFDQGEATPAVRAPRPPKTAPVREGERLFVGIFPGGISYADRFREVSGDYKKIAFLPWNSLELAIYGRPDKELLAQAIAHAATVQAKRGERYPISATGQTVQLGS